jgi:hypothetical protein
MRERKERSKKELAKKRLGGGSGPNSIMARTLKLMKRGTFSRSKNEAMYWKVIVPVVLLTAFLLLAVHAAGPVQSTTFKLAQPGVEQECQLDAALRGVDGVLGYRMEQESGELLVDHRPNVKPQQLARILSARGLEVTLLGTVRILPIHARSFPPGPGVCCRHLAQCPPDVSWRGLLNRWHGPKGR